MDFVTGLLISTDLKGTSYYSIRLMFDTPMRCMLVLQGEFIDSLRDGIAYIYGLEGHQLQFDPCRC